MAYYFPSRVIHKFSGQSGESLPPENLSEGELAINNFAGDPHLLLKDSAGIVRQFRPGSAAGGAIPTQIVLQVATTGDADPVNPIDGDPFDLPSSAIIWARDNLVAARDNELVLNVAEGTYNENPASTIDTKHNFARISLRKEVTNDDQSLYVWNTNAVIVQNCEFYIEDFTVNSSASWTIQEGGFIELCRPEFTWTGGNQAFTIVRGGLVRISSTRRNWDDGHSGGGGGALAATVLNMQDGQFIRLNGSGTIALSDMLAINSPTATNGESIIQCRGRIVQEAGSDRQIRLDGTGNVIEVIANGSVGEHADLWTGTPVYFKKTAQRRPEFISLAEKTVNLYVDPLGSATPSSPINNSNDPFDSPESCFNWAKDNLAFYSVSAGIYVRCAAGTYTMTETLQIPDLGGRVDFDGPNSGSSDPTAVLDFSAVTSGGAVQWQARRGDIRWIKVNLTNGNQFQVRPTAHMNPFRLIVDGTGGSTCRFRVLDNAYVKVSDSSVASLVVRGGYVQNAGTIIMTGVIDVVRDDEPEDLVYENSGVFTADPTNMPTLPLRCNGTSKTVKSWGAGRMFDGSGVWQGAPLFIQDDADRVPDLRLNNTAFANLQNVSRIGQVACIDGKMAFHDGTAWKEITLGAEITS